jgi:hypothetical protein
VTDPWGQQQPGPAEQPPPYGYGPGGGSGPGGGYGYPPPGHPGDPGYPGHPGHPGPPYPGYGFRPGGSPPPSRIGWAITALLLFWPLAIPAFIYSSRVEPAWYQGDVAGAQRASDNVKTCGVVALVIGIVTALLMIVLFAAVFSSVSNSCVPDFANTC